LILFLGKITVVSVNGFFLWLGRLQFYFASVIIYGENLQKFKTFQCHYEVIEDRGRRTIFI
jgi:hypothetical protein